MLVSQIMNTNLISLTPDDSAAQAARLFERHGIGALPVCSKDGKLRGIVTDRDIALRCIAFENPPEETRLREIMTRGVITVTPDEDVREAAKIMASEQIRRLPVLENNRVVGMLALSDLARTRSFDIEISRSLSEISMPEHKFKKHQ